jgi:hypothetical protein
MPVAGRLSSRNCVRILVGSLHLERQCTGFANAWAERRMYYFVDGERSPFHMSLRQADKKTRREKVHAANWGDRTLIVRQGDQVAHNNLSMLLVGSQSWGKLRWIWILRKLQEYMRQLERQRDSC